MALVGNAVINIGAKTMEYEAAVERVRKKNKGFFAELKGSFGKSSTIGQTAALLAGKGVLGGFQKLGSELDDWVKKAQELKEQYHSGAIGLGQMVDEAARGVPVLGKWWGLGRDIRELITGEEADQKKFNDALNQAYTSSKAVAAATGEWKKQLEETLRLLPNRAFSGGLSEAGRAIFDQSEEFRKNSAKGQSDFVKKLQGKDLTELQESIDKLEKQKEKLAKNLHTEGDVGQLGQLSREIDLRKQALREALVTAGKQRDAQQTNNFALARSAAVIGAIKGAYQDLQQQAENPTTMIGKAWAGVQRFTESATEAAKEYGKAVETDVAEKQKNYLEGQKILTKQITSYFEDLFDAQRKFAEESKSMTEAARTPMEKFNQTMDDLEKRKTLGEKFGGISAETYARLSDKAKAELDSTNRTPQMQGAEIRRSSFVTPKAQQDEQKKHTNLLGDIAKSSASMAKKLQDGIGALFSIGSTGAAAGGNN